MVVSAYLQNEKIFFGGFHMNGDKFEKLDMKINHNT